MGRLAYSDPLQDAPGLVGAQRWERKWERRSAANCGQTRSDAVIVALPKGSDVQQRH
jgi:hypothetical protein